MKMTRRWIHRLGAHSLGILMIIGSSFLVMGATGVTQELRGRAGRCQRIVQTWQEWSQTLMTGVPLSGGDEWRQLTEQCPMLIIQACSVKAAEQP